MGGYEHRPLAGIGGWLTFFLIVIGLLSPIRILVEIVSLTGDPAVAAAFGESWGLIAPAEWVLSGIQLAVCAVIVWRLLKVETWQTVRIVIAGLWIANLAVPLVEVVFVAFAAGIPVGQIIAGGGIEVIRGPIFAAIWTAYFLRSERVANTYARPGQADELAEVFD